MTFQKGNQFCYTSNFKHGHAGTTTQSKTYRAWMDMRSRCRYPDRAGYENYGGRGITVCARWGPAQGGSFENFLADMGEAPKGYSLDRKKNNKGYSKSNCKWATRTEQNRNQRSNIKITYRGETQCVAEWARRTSLPSLVIYKRLYRGWAPVRVITTPLRELLR